MADTQRTVASEQVTDLWAWKPGAWDFADLDTEEFPIVERVDAEPAGQPVSPTPAQMSPVTPQPAGEVSLGSAPAPATEVPRASGRVAVSGSTIYTEPVTDRDDVDHVLNPTAYRGHQSAIYTVREATYGPSKYPSLRKIASVVHAVRETVRVSPKPQLLRELASVVLKGHKPTYTETRVCAERHYDRIAVEYERFDKELQRTVTEVANLTYADRDPASYTALAQLPPAPVEVEHSVSEAVEGDDEGRPVVLEQQSLFRAALETLSGNLYGKRTLDGDWGHDKPPLFRGRRQRLVRALVRAAKADDRGRALARQELGLTVAE